MSVTAGRATGKKAAKQSRSRHVRRRSADDARTSARQERLWQLFGEIEREFEKLHEENLQRKQFFTPEETNWCVSVNVFPCTCIVHERVEQLSEKLEYLFTSKQQQQTQPTPQFRGGKRPIGTIFSRRLKTSSASKVHH